MKLIIEQSRPITAFSSPNGSVEIIDDIQITKAEKVNLKRLFTLPSGIINLTKLAIRIWTKIQSEIDIDDSTVFLCPGNGAWLVERLLNLRGIKPSNIKPVDISRESSSEIILDPKPSSIVIIEDVVETGETAEKIAKSLRAYNCDIHLTSTVWHDRLHQTQQVLNAFSRYNTVIIAERMYSECLLSDIRSLSTLARKARANKRNLKYSSGIEDNFLEGMDEILERYKWVKELGKTIGYRKDEV